MVIYVITMGNVRVSIYRKVDKMNPNAPFHQPEAIRDITLIKWAGAKLWSAPERREAEELSKKSRKLDEIKVEAEKRKLLNDNGFSSQRIKYPTLTTTPHSATSNICPSSLAPLRADLDQGLKVLNEHSGTNAFTTDIYLQFICDFANRWHSRYTGVDCHSPGTDPRFYCLDQFFHDKMIEDDGVSIAKSFLNHHLSVEQFWRLRYLLVPISFRKPGQPFYHVALAAISPEARTVEYICSGGDSGTRHSNRTAGSKCVPTIFAFLAHLLGAHPTQGFFPYDWRFRHSHGYLQIPHRKDCGIYTVTHALALAFGYGLQPNGAFPADHQTRIVARRGRYVQDLMMHGFRFYDEDPGEAGADGDGGEEAPGPGGPQYYPLLDTVPPSDLQDGFEALHNDIIRTLPSWAQNRRACYVNCPSRTKLRQHCARNARFYEGWEQATAGLKLREMVAWVEDLDRKRKTGKLVMVPWPEGKPRRWISPGKRAGKGAELRFRGKLWDEA